MHDPMTVAWEVPSYAFRERHPWVPHLLTVWHVDPERDGSDDSCDWFGGKRLTAHQQAVRDKIAKTFAFEWHRGAPYERFGWFMPAGEAVGPNGEKKWWDGEQCLSTHAIVLAMFRIAANEHFGHWSKRADRFLRRHLHNILFFAENSCDSLCTDIEQKHGPRDGDHNKQARRFASVVYGWILRAERPWWKHPRWHVHHWHLQFHPLQMLRRRLLTRCEKCRKRVGLGPVVGTSWSAPPRRWFESFRGERGCLCAGCGGFPASVGPTPREE